jgi:hypothetical protein
VIGSIEDVRGAVGPLSGVLECTSDGIAADTTLASNGVVVGAYARKVANTSAANEAKGILTNVFKIHSFSDLDAQGVYTSIASVQRKANAAADEDAEEDEKEEDEEKDAEEVELAKISKKDLVALCKVFVPEVTRVYNYGDESFTDARMEGDMRNFHSGLARIGAYQAYNEHDTSELVQIHVVGVGKVGKISALVAAERIPAKKLKLVCISSCFNYQSKLTKGLRNGKNGGIC